MSGHFEYDDKWNLGDTLLPSNSDVCASLCVDLTAIQTRCRNLSLSVSDNAGEVFGLTSRVLMYSKSWERLGLDKWKLRQLGQSNWRGLTR